MPWSGTRLRPAAKSPTFRTQVVELECKLPLPLIDSYMYFKSSVIGLSCWVPSNIELCNSEAKTFPTSARYLGCSTTLTRISKQEKSGILSESPEEANPPLQGTRRPGSLY